MTACCDRISQLNFLLFIKKSQWIVKIRCDFFLYAGFAGTKLMKYNTK